MSEFDQSDEQWVKDIVGGMYQPPRRATVVLVHEHATNADPWNHEVTVLLDNPETVPGTENGRLYEVPVLTAATGEAALPSDIDRNYSLTERPSDPEYGDSGREATERTSEGDASGNGNGDDQVDDRPECVVEFVDGDPSDPVVTGFEYDDQNRAITSRVNDRRLTVGSWTMELRTTEDDKQYAQIGETEKPGGTVTRGFVIPPEGTPQIMDGGEDIFAATREQASGGSGAPGDGSGVLPDTDPSAPPEERAAQAGITTNNTKTITSASEIDGASNTLYIVDGSNGPLQHSGKHAIGSVQDVAICGINDASLKIPSGFRDYSITTSGGSNFMWSGIDLDQRADGAYGRLNFNIDNAGFYEDIETIGSGAPADGGTGRSLAQLHCPATSSKGTIRVKDVSLIHGGRFQDTHDQARIGAFGIQFTRNSHKGTLNLVNTQIEEFPNNGIYASACSGTINVDGGRYYNNGVSQIRIADGTVDGPVVGYDHNNTGMRNAAPSGHAVVGIASEQKKGGKGGSVDVKNATVEWKNVKTTRGAVVTYDLHSTGTFGTIESCEISVENAGGAPGVRIDGRADEIVNNSFPGRSKSEAIATPGSVGTVSGNTFG